MSSPKNKSRSPGKKAATVEKTVQNQLDASLLREQEKDVEIERLKTTVKALNSKNFNWEDLHAEIDMLRKQLRD